MGLNWEKGLEGLSDGLEKLTQHAIYKDEVARRERLAAAAAALQERQARLQEAQFQFMKEDRGMQNEFRDRELDIRAADSEANAEYRGDMLGLQERQIENQERQVGVAEQRAETESRRLQIEEFRTENKWYEERARELQDQRREMLNDPMATPDAIASIDQEMTTLKIDATRSALRAKVINIEEFSEMDRAIMDRVKEAEADVTDDASAIVWMANNRDRVAEIYTQAGQEPPPEMTGGEQQPADGPAPAVGSADQPMPDAPRSDLAESAGRVASNPMEFIEGVSDTAINASRSVWSVLGDLLDLSTDPNMEPKEGTIDIPGRLTDAKDAFMEGFRGG